MFRRDAFAAMLLLSATSLAPVLLAGDVVNESDAVMKSKTRTVVIQNKKEKTTTKYILTWSALRSAHVEEGGEAAKPFEGKLIDTRECHWSTRARVIRTESFVDPRGRAGVIETVPISSLPDFQNKGSDLRINMDGAVGKENCNDAKGRWSGDISNTKTAIETLFDRIIEPDFENWKKDYVKDSKVIVIREVK